MPTAASGQAHFAAWTQPRVFFFGRGFPNCDLFVFEIDFSTGLQANLMCLRFLFAGVFLHGGWDLDAQGFLDADLEFTSLFNELRADAAHARASSTFGSYAGPWSKIKEWCSQVPFLPASPLTVALYLTKLMRSASLPSPILSCSGAIFLHHQLAGLPSPPQHPLVAMSCRIARRTKLAGQHIKKPLLASRIWQLFEFGATALAIPFSS